MGEFIKKDKAIEDWHNLVCDCKTQVGYCPLRKYRKDDTETCDVEEFLKIQEGITTHDLYSEESAIDYLRDTGWLPEHDRIMTESSSKKGNWISVAERLPEDSRECITITTNGMKYINQFYPRDHVWMYKNSAVVAWYPLPDYISEP